MRKYKDKKDKNLVALEKEGNGFLIKQKQFDPETGLESDEIVEKQTLAGIDILISDAEDRLADLQQLKTDAQAL